MSVNGRYTTYTLTTVPAVLTAAALSSEGCSGTAKKEISTSSSARISPAFSRDTVIIEQYINGRFLEWGVRFIGIADSADSESESYGTMRLFASAYNEMYVRDISSKIRRTLAYKREQGQFIGSFAPYGYMISPEDRHRLIIDEDAAGVVRRIFAMYVSGMGYRGIVQELNARAIPGPSAYKRQKGSKYSNSNAESGNPEGLWTQSTIARILANEMYTGTLVQGKSHHISYKNKKRKKVEQDEWIRIPDAHEALIDRDTWQRTQERLRSHARVGKSSGELSPLSGKVRCAVCGRPMKRNVYYNKARTVRYYSLQCASHKTGAMDCPNKSSISGLMLERSILSELNCILEKNCRPENIRIGDIRSDRLKELEKKLSVLLAKQSNAKDRLVRMYKDKLDGTLSDEDYFLFRKSLSQEEQALSVLIEDTVRQIELCRSEASPIGKSDVIEKYIPLNKLDRTAADEFIDCIEIGLADKNGLREVHIRWKL